VRIAVVRLDVFHFAGEVLAVHHHAVHLLISPIARARLLSRAGCAPARAAALPQKRRVIVLECIQVEMKLQVRDRVLRVVLPHGGLAPLHRLGRRIQSRVNLVTHDRIGNVLGVRCRRRHQHKRSDCEPFGQGAKRRALSAAEGKEFMHVHSFPSQQSPAPPSPHSSSPASACTPPPRAPAAKLVRPPAAAALPRSTPTAAPRLPPSTPRAPPAGSTITHAHWCCARTAYARPSVLACPSPSHKKSAVPGTAGSARSSPYARRPAFRRLRPHPRRRSTHVFFLRNLRACS